MQEFFIDVEDAETSKYCRGFIFRTNEFQNRITLHLLHLEG